jgi:Ca2+-binding RTX toxin-like protein
VGGLGNDTYVVDNVTDTISETSAVAAEIDTVRSSASFTLGVNVENLVLIGNAAINGTGNSLANVLTGNGAANTLNGGTGADKLIGGLGNDTYVTDGGDTLTEAVNGGTDRVLSSVSLTLGANLENLTLTGNAAIDGTGNSLANVLTGNGAANILNGGTGADKLIGGLGNDTFVFSTALGVSTIDTITDFSVVADTIRLSHGIFNTIVGTGALSTAQFSANAGGIARDASDRIIYETDTGKMFFDSNGNAAGGSIQFAVLSTNLALTNQDFFIT